MRALKPLIREEPFLQSIRVSLWQISNKRFEEASPSSICFRAQTYRYCSARTIGCRSTEARIVMHLLAKDEGWLAAYFDALSRVSSTQQSYFTEPRRLRRFYEALRGRNISPGPAKPVFRPDPGLLLLVTRLQLDPNEQPHVPGNLEVWREILRRNRHFKTLEEWARREGHLNSPDQLVEAMFALSRENSEGGPLQAFLALSEIDRARSPQQRLD